MARTQRTESTYRVREHVIPIQSIHGKLLAEWERRIDHTWLPIMDPDTNKIIIGTATTYNGSVVSVVSHRSEGNYNVWVFDYPFLVGNHSSEELVIRDIVKNAPL